MESTKTSDGNPYRAKRKQPPQTGVTEDEKK